MNNLKISAEEIELFRNAVKTSTPIKNEFNQPYKNKPKPRAIYSRQDNKEVLIESDYIIENINIIDIPKKVLKIHKNILNSIKIH